MAAKKPEKSKQKPVAKMKKAGKEKPVEIRAKAKGLLKKADKAGDARANAVGKAKSTVRSALEKVAAKVVKSVQSTSNGASAKGVKATAAAPVKPAKGAKAPAAPAIPAKAAKGAKVAKAEKEVPEKLAKGAKPAKIAKGAKVEVAPVVEVPVKKGAKAAKAEAKAEAAAKKHAAAKNKCREVGCENEGLLSSYCRLHYIKNWRRIKKKESILSTGQLDGYVEELVAKYPDKYLDAIENDLHSEKEWTKVVSDLELGAGGEDDFVADEDDNPITEATGRGRGSGFDDEDEDVY